MEKKVCKSQFSGEEDDCINSVVKISASNQLSQLTHVCDYCEVFFARNGPAIKLKNADVQNTFCSTSCKDAFMVCKKICISCGKDLQHVKNSVILESSTGVFKEFCSEKCSALCSEKVPLEKTTLSVNQRDSSCDTKSYPIENRAKCCVCNNWHTLSCFKIGYQRFCSKECFHAYKTQHDLEMKYCNQCCAQLLDVNKGQQYMQHEGKAKIFCNSVCLMQYKKMHTKMCPCNWCLKTRTNFQMIERVESSGETTYFCSLDCLNNFRVKESRLIAMTKCETCGVTGTMTSFSHKSDKTVKGFCSSKCVKQYQGYMKQQTTEVTTSFTNNQSKGDFIISDVRSIAHGERSNIVPTDLVTPSFTTVTDSSGKRFVLVNKNCSMPKGSLNVPREIIRAKRTDSKLTKSLADCSNGIKFKNKSIMCKPYQHDKASQVECSCKTVDAQTKTDKSRDVCLLPVPVYVPCPVKMYTDYAPVPFPIPIPVAVPVFIPTLLNNVNDILNTIEEIKASVPTNPLEADLIMMAEAVAQTERMKNVDFEMNLTQEVVSESDACSNSVISSNTEKDQLAANCDVLVDNDDVEMGTAYNIPDSTLNVISELEDCIKEPPTKKHKTNETLQIIISENTFAEYGILMLRRWMEQNEVKTSLDNIIHCLPYEINSLLSNFISTVKDYDGTSYPPDHVFYILLGIQLYSKKLNRDDNIFADVMYRGFQDKLYEYISKDSRFLDVQQWGHSSKVCEEHLWECSHLGAHSPQTLLFTVIYFITKEFLLRTVDEHHSLIFGNIQKQILMQSRTSHKNKVCYRYVKTVKTPGRISVTKVKAKSPNHLAKLMIKENQQNQLRCPVRLFEFYLSKCPSTIKASTIQHLYLQQESCCIPESPIWFSETKLSSDDIHKMLARVLLVNDIYHKT